MKQKSFFDDEINKDDEAKRGKPTPFDGEVSQQLKKDGMDAAAAAKPRGLALAREIAEEIGRKQEHVNADDVGILLWTRHGIASLGGAAGHLFIYAAWEWTGIRVPSTRKSNHGRDLKVYRLKDRNGKGE